MNPPAIVATLATEAAFGDLALLLGTLALWNTPPTVYAFCDDGAGTAVSALGYPGRIIVERALNPYRGLTRQEMERQPGQRYKTLWMDFMTEKIQLLEWIFKVEEEAAKRAGILFCDADICWMGPLPTFPLDARVALSHHEIRAADEARFGAYNGGMLWLRDPAYLGIWSEACRHARFYEQSALEDVAAVAEAKGELWFLPRTQNYGWWRLWQGERPAAELQAEWSVNRARGAGTSGITVAEQPLGSVHTHFGERSDMATTSFNQFVIGFLRKLRPSFEPAKRLLRTIEIVHPIVASFP